MVGNRPERWWRWLPAGLLALLAGCATPDQPPPAAAAGNPAEVVWRSLQRTAECVTEVENRPDFAALKRRTPDNYDDPASRPLMTSEDLASIEERRQIQGFRQAIAGCRPAFDGLTDPGATARAVEIQRIWDRQQELYTFLQSGSLPWGRFNRETKANSEQLMGLVRGFAPAPAAVAEVPAAAAPPRPTTTAPRGGPPPEPAAAVPVQTPPPVGVPPVGAPPPAGPAAMPAARAMAPLPVPPAPAMAAARARSPAPPAPPPQAEPPAMAPPLGGAEFRVHLASYRTGPDADRGWAVLMRKAPGPLAGLQPSTALVEVPGRGTFVRLFGGPFPSQAAAAAACAELKRQLGYCRLLPER